LPWSNDGISRYVKQKDSFWFLRKSIENFAPQMSFKLKPHATFVLLFTLVLAFCASASAGTLWYNGDMNGVKSILNQNNSIADQIVYNDFLVPTTWHVNDVWSNNIFDVPPASTTGTWEIRSNMPAGTLVASGDAAATLTPTGFTFHGVTEYQVLVSGLNVTLAPGRYWLAVYPDNTNGGGAGNDTTSGANAVGTPPGNNGELFISHDGGVTFRGPYRFDTSAGVGGTATPEPSSLMMLGSGLLGVAGVIRRKLS
jgi:hypothetical protein